MPASARERKVDQLEARRAAGPDDPGRLALALTSAGAKFA
jgi:hypothetical protein